MTNLPYVSRETAELAATKNFDDQTQGHYYVFGQDSEEYIFFDNQESADPDEVWEHASYVKKNPYHVLAVPTQAQLQMWLRVVHKVHIELILVGEDEYRSVLTNGHRTRIVGIFPTYEQALEEGLARALRGIAFYATRLGDELVFQSLRELTDFLQEKAGGRLLGYDTVRKPLVENGELYGYALRQTCVI